MQIEMNVIVENSVKSIALWCFLFYGCVQPRGFFYGRGNTAGKVMRNNIGGPGGKAAAGLNTCLFAPTFFYLDSLKKSEAETGCTIDDTPRGRSNYTACRATLRSLNLCGHLLGVRETPCKLNTK